MAEMRAVTCFLLVIALFAHVSQQQPNTCGRDWVRLGGSCYRFGREPLTWPEASWMCRAYGGYLAEINSLEENNVVVAQLRPLPAIYQGRAISHWIGASDIVAEGHWSWLSNDELIGPYTNWSPTQPDNWRGVEHCLEIRPAYDYKWNDDECYIRHMFVCESRYYEACAIRLFRPALCKQKEFVADLKLPCVGGCFTCEQYLPL